MSKRSLSSRPRSPKKRRTPFPLPPLPRTLIDREIAYRLRLGRPRFLGPPLADAPPLRPEDLTRGERARLRQRAEVRAQRIGRRAAQDGRDRFWLHAELTLSLHGATAQTRRAWRTRVRWAIHHAETHVADLRTLEALIRAHEPTMDAWLRGQLTTLDVGRPA